MRLRARWALPIASEPIEDAEVVVEGHVIAEVRQRKADGFPVADSRDFGEAVILPGFVNAHAHLEYTALRGLLDDLPFFAWIRALTDLKRALESGSVDGVEEVEPARFWKASAVLGAAEAVAGGATTIADCTDSGAALDGLLAVGARGIVYQEVFGVEEDVPADAIVASAKEAVAALADRANAGQHSVGVSPHSPYTVRPDLMRAIGEWAMGAELPLCIHAAESGPEVEFIRRGTGEIGDHLKVRGVAWHDLGAHRPRSSLTHLRACGVLGPRTLLVHGVNVSACDRDTVAETGASFAHCPRSNAVLGIGTAPLRWMARCSDPPRVGLGTDSAVSSGSLDMLEEMRCALLLQRAVHRTGRVPCRAREALEMATIGGARALGLADRIGSLRPGYEADIGVLALGSRRFAPINDVTSAVVYQGAAHDVIMTMVAGRIVFENGCVHGVGMETARKCAECVSARLATLARGARSG